MADSSASPVPRWLWRALVAAAIVLVAVDPWLHHHASFGVDGTFGFYAWYTVVAGVIGVGLARSLAWLLGYSGGDDV